MRLDRRVILALCLLAVAPGGVAQPVRELTILHVNDFHAALEPVSNREGGVAALATVLRRERDGCRSCMFVSAGDVVQGGSPVSTIFKGVPIYEIFRLLKPDAATLGNHEFDYNWRQIPRFMRAGRFPIVAANVADEGGRLLTGRPYLIHNVNGIRVGVIGIMTETLAGLLMPENLGPWKTGPVIETARRSAAELRPRTDFLILLAHITPAEEDRILRELPEVPATISGHTHVRLEQAKTHEGRILVRVPDYGRELGRLELKVDVGKKALVSSNWRRIPVRAGQVPAAPDVARRVAKWEAKVAKVVDQPIAEARRTLTQPMLKTMFERAIVEEMRVDFAFINRGGVRMPIPAGTVLIRHVFNTYPFDNLIVTGKFKGRQLPAAVVAGRTIDADREYTLAVTDYTAANQDGPMQLGVKGLEFPTTGPPVRDILINWIRKQKVLE